MSQPAPAIRGLGRSAKNQRKPRAGHDFRHGEASGRRAGVTHPNKTSPSGLKISQFHKKNYYAVPHAVATAQVTVSHRLENPQTNRPFRNENSDGERLSPGPGRVRKYTGWGRRASAGLMARCGPLSGLSPRRSQFGAASVAASLTRRWFVLVQLEFRTHQIVDVPSRPMSGDSISGDRAQCGTRPEVVAADPLGEIGLQRVSTPLSAAFPHDEADLATGITMLSFAGRLPTPHGQMSLLHWTCTVQASRRGVGV